MPGPRVTQRQVADEAGVSRTTVSLVLNDVPDAHITSKTRQRVLEAARRLNYYPNAAARRLVSGRTRTIALVWHRGPDETYRDAFLPGLLQGITRAARHCGYYVIFRPIEPGEIDDSYVELARGRHSDGLILSGPRSDDTELLALHREGFPLVLHGQLPGTDVPSVDVDNVRGAMAGVNHLLTLGHRRIGMVTNAPLTYVSSRQRLKGYRQALEQADLPFDEDLVQYGNFDEESGYAAVEALLAVKPAPSALFVASDMVAMGALRALHDRGRRVPEEMAVVGFDDITAARFIIPALTTVHVPTFGLGWGAAELLIRIINGDQPNEIRVLLHTELVIRESCGASTDRDLSPQQSFSSTQRREVYDLCPQNDKSIYQEGGGV